MNVGYVADHAELDGGLPVVDDLQVAAAAAAAMADDEATTSSDNSDSSSSSEYSSSDGTSTYESDESDEDGVVLGVRRPLQPYQTTLGEERWCVHLVDTGDQGIKLILRPEEPYTAAALDDMDDHVSQGEGDCSDEAEDEDIEEIEDYDELRRIIDSMDGDEGGMGDANGEGPTAAVELFGEAPPPALDVSLAPEDSLSAAGTVLSVIEGTIVVRASAGSRALDEGSVLVLQDRMVIGAIEDIFGPVQAPLYALRCVGDPPDGLIPEASVFSVDRLAQFVLPEELRVKGYDDWDESAVDQEKHFSDDEAEAAYKRKLKSKRKGDATGGTEPSTGGQREGTARRGGTRVRRGRATHRGGGHGVPWGAGPPFGPAMPGFYGPGPQGPMPYQPGPAQYLGQLYAPGFGGGLGMPPNFGHVARHHGSPSVPSGQFRAHSTAGQLGAMALQPHHAYPYAMGGMRPPGGPQYRPPPPSEPPSN